MTKRPWVLHPFWLAPLPILRLYSSNLKTLPISHLMSPTFVTLSVVGVLFGCLRLARLDGPRAGLITSVSLLLFFGFGRVVQTMGRFGIRGDRLALEKVTLAVAILAIAAVVILLIRFGPGFARSVNLAGNAGSTALLAIWLVGYLSQLWVEPSRRPPVVARPVAPPMELNPARKPSVYYLVLDAYGRSDVLNEIYGFDNSGFLDRLEKQGFFVARQSTSNYGQTALSFAATLNYRYLDDLAGSSSENRLPLRDLIQNSAVLMAFKNEGYQIISFATGFDATELTSADQYLQPEGNLSGFATLLADQTPLWLLLARRSESVPHRMHRARVQFTLDHWPIEPPLGNAPTFCFAHILSPHPPFDFGADGRDTSAREGLFALGDGEVWREAKQHGGPDEYQARYREQASYLTLRVEQAIATIRSRHSPTDQPIIILQGDHGPGSHYQSDAKRPTDVRERMSILYAVFLPDGSREGLDPSITPVNTFRVVLDHYFGTKLGRLPDRNFASPYRTPYRFVEVTDQLTP